MEAWAACPAPAPGGRNAQCLCDWKQREEGEEPAPNLLTEERGFPSGSMDTGFRTQVLGHVPF